MLACIYSNPFVKFLKDAACCAWLQICSSLQSSLNPVLVTQGCERSARNFEVWKIIYNWKLIVNRLCYSSHTFLRFSFLSPSSDLFNLFSSAKYSWKNNSQFCFENDVNDLQSIFLIFISLVYSFWGMGETLILLHLQLHLCLQWQYYLFCK